MSRCLGVCWESTTTNALLTSLNAVLAVRGLLHSFFRTICATREALIAAHNAHRPLFFLGAYPQLSTKKFSATIA